MSIAATLRLVLARPHPAGHPFIAGGIAAIMAGLIVAGWLAWIGLIFTLFCLYFFRDPVRVPPTRAGLVLAPADGKVVSVSPAVPPAELGLGADQRWRVGIFLSVLDVHVNRIPVDGTVGRIAYRHGRFVNASMDKASVDNERNALALHLPDGRAVAVVQIAGLIARRILCDVHEGDPVRTGERFGIIRFGSRTDIYLPAGVHPLVSLGQTMVGGETVLADLSPPATIAPASTLNPE
jgi:phosphatidylserine decarboxylase